MNTITLTLDDLNNKSLVDLGLSIIKNKNFSNIFVLVTDFSTYDEDWEITSNINIYEKTSKNINDVFTMMKESDGDNSNSYNTTLDYAIINTFSGNYRCKTYFYVIGLKPNIITKFYDVYFCNDD